MFYKCELKELAAQSALSIRTRTSVQNLPNILSEGYGAIAQYLNGVNKQPSGAPFAIYYNWDMQNLDVEFGFPVEEGIEGNNNIKVSITPGGKVATCLYIGSYNKIETAYKALMKWIEDNKYETTGIAYEVYLNDPAQTPLQELKTQISLLLKNGIRNV